MGGWQTWRVSTGFLADYLPYLLQHADQRLSARFHRSLQRRGLQTSEWRVLAVLFDDGPRSIGALTTRSLLPQPTTTHAVARLESRGDVRRFAGAADGRQRIVDLTDAGRRLAAELTESARFDLAATLEAAGIDHPAEFSAQLKAMIATLD